MMWRILFRRFPAQEPQLAGAQPHLSVDLPLLLPARGMWCALLLEERPSEFAERPVFGFKDLAHGSPLR